MFSVECLGQGFRERRGAGVIDNHADPGNRLQNRPMRPDNEDEHGDNHVIGQPGMHGWKLGLDQQMSNRISELVGSGGRKGFFKQMHASKVLSCEVRHTLVLDASG